MRHSRSKEFSEALASVVQSETGRWTRVATDPNAAAALARRAETLRRAWRPATHDRNAFLEQRCAGRRVLDVGCVAHEVGRMDSPQWLHGRIAAVATRCVGVDVVADAIREMRARGLDAVLHDLRDGMGPLADRMPFDVIVAGELIEHVESLDMLFRTAQVALAPGGELIITTPNPYAPKRVWAGQRGIVWENVDHILYAFPSGIAELAERHGLVLVEAATTEGKNRRRELVPKALVQRLLGRRWRSVGYSTKGVPGTVLVRGPAPPTLSFRRPRRFTGETFVYVITRAADEPRGATPRDAGRAAE